MKWIIFSFIIVVNIFANTLSIENFKTDLYSKTGNNVLKTIELNLEFEGENLEEKKIIDALNTIISSYFYEDLFTEIGKTNFKETLLKFSNKKYKTQIKNIYLLKVNSVKEFDIEELKKFLQELDSKEEKITKSQNLVKEEKPIKEEHNSTKTQDLNTSGEKINSDFNTTIDKEANVSKEAMDMILKTMENSQMQMLAPSKNEELFKELPF
ncbi:flagellar basal body-associated FliL family protein [Campylobacter volucris]|uniref:flagellar basal body-associated FliL family protein n=1 Tax=Campylobacter volucris TaxID=1031542 RepID=UPI00189C821C|nr:flagellar basal body-associated FliL family protein [Campylobacter volucris]MBF7048037.1 flagellar basal body-associated FliL family protein [Campylobacter volucris]MBF7068640.1 flagellar basal body-associated FliL family protein [Campylobacter volucris]